MVPFVDLGAQYKSIKSEIDVAIQDVLDSTGFIGGSEVTAFEQEFAAYCAAGGEEHRVEAPPNGQINGARTRTPLHCVGCGSGSDALYLCLLAMGIGDGDEVITVSHTFIATAAMISRSGARPVFVDIRDDTMLMDPDRIEAAITPRTRAILPVHLYGQPCEMDRILAIARRHGLKVIEDAAQAHGARWRGQRPGSLGDAAAFSFYPGKNLGAYGDGGAVVSSDSALIERIRSVADHGRLDKYVHTRLGINSRLDAVQAAILRVKLHHLDAWNTARQRHASTYTEGLQDSPVIVPTIHPDAASVWHLYVVRTPERERLQSELSQAGISSGVHYPIAVHRQPAYAHLGLGERTLPITERAAREVVSLPMYAELPEQAQARAIEVVRSFAPQSPSGENRTQPRVAFDTVAH